MGFNSGFKGLRKVNGSVLYQSRFFNSFTF